MTKFRTALIILAAVVCAACETPQTSASGGAATEEARAETPAADETSICNDEGMETVVQVRGIPVPEREAVADSIRERVCSGELPAASDGIVQEGEAEVRWRRQRIAS